MPNRRLQVILGHPSYPRLDLPSSGLLFPIFYIRRESGYVAHTRTKIGSYATRVSPFARDVREKERKSSRAPAFILHDFHESYTGDDELFLVTGGRRGDKRQIPTAGNELPKRRGGAVKEGHITQRTTRGRTTWVFTRWGKKEGCVVCRLSSGYISPGIPAFRFFSADSTDYV